MELVCISRNKNRNLSVSFEVFLMVANYPSVVTCVVVVFLSSGGLRGVSVAELTG